MTERINNIINLINGETLPPTVETRGFPRQNFYEYYIGIDNYYNFSLFNDILLTALNVVMVDTDRRELEQMFYNANQWYSYRTPKVYC